MKKENVLKYYQQKLAALQQKLQSKSYCGKIHFGRHNPLNVPLCLCEQCGEGELLIKAQNEKSDWIVRCKHCGHSPAAPQKRAWQAKLEWNLENLAYASLAEIPFFDLKGLTPEAIIHKVSDIQSSQELRINIAKLERSIAQINHNRPPGKKYQEKLEAYLGWARFALGLAKAETEKKPAMSAGPDEKAWHHKGSDKKLKTG